MTDKELIDECRKVFLNITKMHSFAGCCEYGSESHKNYFEGTLTASEYMMKLIDTARENRNTVESPKQDIPEIVDAYPEVPEKLLPIALRHWHGQRVSIESIESMAGFSLSFKVEVG